MNFLVSIFSSEKSSISATGSGQIAAGSTDEAIGFAKHCADPGLWPPGSTWICVPLDESSGQFEVGTWNPG